MALIIDGGETQLVSPGEFINFHDRPAFRNLNRLTQFDIPISYSHRNHRHNDHDIGLNDILDYSNFLGGYIDQITKRLEDIILWGEEKEYEMITKEKTFTLEFTARNIVGDHDVLRSAVEDVYKNYETVLKHMSDDIQKAYDEKIEEKYPLIVPEKGNAFFGYKVAYTNICGNTVKVLIKLLIPSDAERSNGRDRKCRCSKAKVLFINVLNNDRSVTDTEVNTAYSSYDEDFIYKLNEMAIADRWDDNRFHECSHGIHFFMNEQEALGYDLI